MHKLRVKFRGGKPIATDPTKQDFLERLTNDYERRDIEVELSFEIPSKNINADQVKVYNAFIVKAAKHFGTDFGQMKHILKNLEPKDFGGNSIPVSKWNNQQLNTFIDQASSYLAEFGFNF